MDIAPGAVSACSDTQLQAARRARATLTMNVTHCFIFYSSFVPSFFFVCSLFSFLLSCTSLFHYFLFHLLLFCFLKIFHLISSLYLCLLAGFSVFIVSDLPTNGSIYHFSLISVSLPCLSRTSERQVISAGIQQFAAFYRLIFFLMVQQSQVGQGLLNIEASRSHSDTPYSVGLLRTIDQPDPVTSTCTRHNSHKRQISIPTAGFETAISASERPQTHALESTATFCPLIVIINTKLAYYRHIEFLMRKEI